MTASVARRTLMTAIPGPLAAILAGALVATVSGPASAGGCVSAECYRRVHTPPVYGFVNEQVLVQPPQTVYRTVPAVYDTVTEQVLLAPASRRWETRTDAYGQLIGCWVTTPPRYAARTRRVLVREAQVVPETVPPVYTSTQRRVLVQPARAEWVPAGPGTGPVYGPGPDVGVSVGSIPDAFGITGASSADVGVGLGFSRGSIYDGY